MTLNAIPRRLRKQRRKANDIGLGNIKIKNLTRVVFVGQKSSIGISFYCKQSPGISSRPIDIILVIMHIIHINNGSTSG